MTDESGLKVVAARRGPDGELILEIEPSSAALRRLRTAHRNGDLAEAHDHGVITFRCNDAGRHS